MARRGDEFSRAVEDLARLVGRVVGEMERELPTLARAAREVGRGAAAAAREEWPTVREAARRVAQAAREQGRRG